MVRGFAHLGVARYDNWSEQQMSRCHSLSRPPMQCSAPQNLGMDPRWDNPKLPLAELPSLVFTDHS